MAGRGRSIDPSFSTALLAWYRRERRRLPWRPTRRGSPDPWSVWVSEVMLQQTQVATVVPYFLRFMQRFPAPRDLAEAGEAEALSYWSGLGYYSRLRSLRAGAALMGSRLARGEGYPRTAREWRKVPGVGEYTSAAIASIAFGEPVPVVDGNVARVVVRLLALQIDSREALRDKRVRRFLDRSLSKKHPGDFNQAMMELGATVCSPRAPRCDRCPLSGRCVARRQGRVDDLPRPAPRRDAEKLQAVAFCIRRGTRWLLRQRTPADRSLLLPSTSSGLFEPLILHIRPREAPGRALGRLAPCLLNRLILGTRSRVRIQHTVLHYRIQVEPIDARLVGRGLPTGMSWATPNDPRFPLTAIARKIIRLFP